MDEAGPGNEAGPRNEVVLGMRQVPGYEAGPGGMRQGLPFGHTSQLESFYHCVS